MTEPSVQSTVTSVAPDGTITITTVLKPAPSPAPPPPPPAPVPSTRRSGLAWDSGVFANDKTMPGRWETMRGRKVDLADVHCDASDIANPWWLYDYTPATVGGLVLSTHLLATTPPSAYTAAGKAMRDRGFTGPAARLRTGAEFNLSGSLSKVTNATVDAWIERFRAAAAAFRTGNGPGCRIVLCPNEGNGSGLVSQQNVTKIADVLLRDGTADELGVDFYDQYPASMTQAQFDARVDPVTFGSLGWWAKFASDRGRLISLPEWGCGSNVAPGQWAGHAGGDNPAFITGILGWLKANAPRVGYEAYFAEPAPYIACDLSTQMPKARAAYVAGLA